LHDSLSYKNYRVRETDIDLAKEALANGITAIFVRNKVNLDLDDVIYRRRPQFVDDGDLHEEIATEDVLLTSMRNNFEEQLAVAGIHDAHIFLIDARKMVAYPGGTFAYDEIMLTVFFEAQAAVKKELDDDAVSGSRMSDNEKSVFEKHFASIAEKVDYVVLKAFLLEHRSDLVDESRITKVDSMGLGLIGKATYLLKLFKQFDNCLESLIECLLGANEAELATELRNDISAQTRESTFLKG